MVQFCWATLGNKTSSLVLNCVCSGVAPVTSEGILFMLSANSVIRLKPEAAPILYWVDPAKALGKKTF